MRQRGLGEQEVMHATVKIIAPRESKIVKTAVTAVFPISVGGARGVLDWVDMSWHDLMETSFQIVTGGWKILQ